MRLFLVARYTMNDVEGIFMHCMFQFFAWPLCLIEVYSWNTIAVKRNFSVCII